MALPLDAAPQRARRALVLDLRRALRGEQLPAPGEDRQGVRLRGGGLRLLQPVFVRLGVGELPLDLLVLDNAAFFEVEWLDGYSGTPAVLDAVDWVFGEEAAASGLAPPGEVNHQHSRKQDPGRVELWPLIAADKVETDTTAVEAPGGVLTPPHQRLARLIAVHAKGLIGNERRARKTAGNAGLCTNPISRWRRRRKAGGHVCIIRNDLRAS